MDKRFVRPSRFVLVVIMFNDVKKCYVCNFHFAESDVSVKCDGCCALGHVKCTELRTSEFGYLGLPGRLLRFFCLSCEQGLRELPVLKELVKKLQSEVDGLKNRGRRANDIDPVVNTVESIFDSSSVSPLPDPVNYVL